MKIIPFKFWLAITVLASVAAVVFFFLGDERSELPLRKHPPITAVAVPSGTPPVATTPPTSSEKTPQSLIEPDQAAPLPGEKSAILATIQEVSVSYSAEGLPKIRPFLLHSDSEIRAAALQGMIAVSDASAGPMFRAAASQAPTPEEAEALRKAANFIELPAGSLIPKNKSPKP